MTVQTDLAWQQGFSLMGGMRYWPCAAIALLVTAVLGIAGYVVQNKASIAANVTQHELIGEAAERQRQEDKAVKQLERVQMQNAEFVRGSSSRNLVFPLPDRESPSAVYIPCSPLSETYLSTIGYSRGMIGKLELKSVDGHRRLVYPLATLNNQFNFAFLRAAYDCGLDACLTTWKVGCVSPPTQPYALAVSTGLAAATSLATNSFLMLPPEDLARLADDPVKRALWVDFATHTIIPPLRELVVVLHTTVLPPFCPPLPRSTHR
jgi:hypothetical protein